MVSLGSKDILTIGSSLATMTRYKDDVGSLVVLTKSLSLENKLLAMGMANVSEEMIELVLKAQGVTAAEIGMAQAKTLSTTATGADTVATALNVKAKNTLTVAQMKLNAAIAANPYLVVGAVIIGTIAAISKAQQLLQKSIQETIDVSKDLVTEYQNQKETLQSNRDTVEELSSDYETLSKGIDSFGNNISLTQEEFNRYHEITSQIADMFPSMVKGYDEQGNAILKNKGNVEELTNALKEQQRVSNQTIIDSGEDVFKGVKNEVSQTKSEIDDLNKAILLLNGGAVGDNLTKGVKDIFNQYDVSSSYLTDSSGTRRTYGVTDNTSDLEKQKHAETLNTLMYKQNELLREQETIQSRVNSVVQAYLENSIGYESLDEDMQDYVLSISNAINPSKWNYDANVMKDFILENIIIPINENKDGVQSSFSDLMSLDMNELSSNDYLKQVDSLISSISKTLGVDSTTLKVSLGIDADYNSIYSALQELDNKVDDDVFSKISQLNGEDIKIAYEIENIGTLTFDEIQEEINKIKNKSVNIDIKLSTSETISTLESIKSGLELIDEIYQDVVDKESFDFSNLIDNGFVEKFGTLGDAYTEFIDTVSSSPTDIEKCRSAFENLTSEYIYQSNVLSDVTEDNRQLVESWLKQQGVANATEIVTGALVDRIVEQGKAAILAGEDSGQYKDRILEMGGSSKAAELALYQLQMQEIALNNTTLSFSDKISELNKLATAAGIASVSMEAINTAARYYAYDGLNAEEAKQKALDDYISTLGNKLQQASKLMVDFTGITSGSSSSGSSGSSSSSSDTISALEKEIELIKDKYDLELKGLENMSDYLDYLAIRIPENSADMIKHNEEVLSVLEKSIQNRQGKLEALLSLDGIMDEDPELVYEVQSQLRSLETEKYELSLSNIDLMIDIDKSKFTNVDEIVTQLETKLALAVANSDLEIQLDVNTKLKENTQNQLEAVTAMIGKYEQLRSAQTKGSNEYIKYTEILNDLYSEQGDLVDDQISRIKTLSSLQAEYEVYGKLGKSVWEDNYDKKVDGINAEIEALENLNKEKEKENEIEKTKLEILELEEKLRNLYENKEIQVLKKQDDGTWDWEYISDYKEISEAEKELNEKRLELEDIYEEQKLESKLESLENQLATLENEKEEKNRIYEQLLSDLEESNLKMLTETINHYDDMKNNTANGLKNLDIAINTGLDNMYDTYDSWLSDIYSNVSRYVDKIRQELESVDIDMPSSISSQYSASNVNTRTVTPLALSYDTQAVGASYASSVSRMAAASPSVNTYSTNSLETVNNSSSISIGNIEIIVPNEVANAIDIASELGEILSGLSNEAKLVSSK